MIRELEIRNFKSHRVTKLNIRNLTVLCGGNGVGKSSIMQTLLLLREAFIKDKSFNILDLKSNAVKIGTANDAIYEFTTDATDTITVGFKSDIGRYNFVYEADTQAEKVKSFIRAKEIIVDISDKSIDINNESLFNTNFQFISSARLGPQAQYSKDDKVIDVYKQISIIEGKAEYFVHFLEANKNLNVIKDIQHSSSDLPELFPQVIAWEQEISEGVNIEIQDLGKLGFVLKYYFDTEASGTKRTKLFEAANVGFGLSYVMPILVAILSSKKDTLLFIENPEAHLHPKGIAKLTELICLAAQAGIQIILETHSDHVINGILVQCKRFEEAQTGITRQNVAIYHFDRDDSKHCTDVKEVKIEENGLIRYTPKGFFDQFTIDRKYLMGF
jgi:predicted ATPase